MVEKAAALPRWEIVRSIQELDYFEGIEAADPPAALEAFYRGEGEINLDRREHPPWTLRAVRVG